MQFDFYPLYKTYATLELLKITERPDDYQPEAVATAMQVLDERGVTDEDFAALDQYFLEKEQAKNKHSRNLKSLEQQTTDTLVSILQPEEELSPNKWLRILLVIVVLQYALYVYKSIKQLVAFFQCYYCSVNTDIWLMFFTLLYIPVIFTLLFRRRRWGWILLFANNLFSLIVRCSETFLFFNYQSIFQSSTAYFLILTGVKAAIVLMLWKDPVANYFDVSNIVKKNTVLVTTAGTVLLLFVAYLTLRNLYN